MSSAAARGTTSASPEGSEGVFFGARTPSPPTPLSADAGRRSPGAPQATAARPRRCRAQATHLRYCTGGASQIVLCSSDDEIPRKNENLARTCTVTILHVKLLTWLAILGILARRNHSPWGTTFHPCASPAFHRFTLVGRAVDHWDRCTGARNGNARQPLRRDAYQSTRRARVPTLVLCQHMHSHWTTSQRISPASSTSLTSLCPSILGGNPTFPHDSRAILRVVSMPPECACRLARR